MGQKDTITKAYMGRPDIFADVFNQYIYKGRQVIRPENLQEMDTAQIALPYGADGGLESLQKVRDVQKLMLSMTDGTTAYCILAVENESKIHYAMPVRNGLYDFIQLSNQVSAASRRYHKNKGKGLTADEYMSGFRKSDRLLPVITIVYYFGADEWDGPLNLRDMYRDCSPEILQNAPDYHINLIAPKYMTDEAIDGFQTNLREITKYIKYSNDKDSLNRMLTDDDRFKKVENQAVELINIVTGSNIRYASGEETVNMCLALEQIREESEQKGQREGQLEGRIIGAIEFCRKMSMQKSAVAEYISDEFGKTAAEAQSIVEQYWK